MGVEPTSLSPFSTPALSVHDHRRPRLQSAHPSEVGAASDTGAGHQLRHRESVLRFSELAGSQRTGPLSSSPALRYWQANQAPLGSQTLAPAAPLTQPLSDITLTAPRAKSLGTDACRSAVEYFAFCAVPGGRPPDLRHQFGRPQALDALPSSLIGMRAISRGIQGRHQPSTTSVNSPDSA